MRILVTGGAGYIGAHTLVELLGQGHEALVVDDFSNGSQEALDRVKGLTNGGLSVAEADVRDTRTLTDLARDYRPEAAIHFAGLKAVGESAEKPVDYYDVNVGGTLALLRAMSACACHRIVFSSSATVYGEPVYLPYDEDHPLQPASVYGMTKRMAEAVITDWAAGEARAGRPASAMILRYFNPVGAHRSGRIGEDPQGVPQNLMPFLAQVAAGRRERLTIHGDDWPTPDGTGVRDYIHVTDLARAHVAALDHAAGGDRGAQVFNIGTGRGVSVREMQAAFERIVGHELPARVGPRRAGDIAEMQADCTRAARVLGWRAEFGVEDMVASLWRWQTDNPQGYGSGGSEPQDEG